MSPHDEGRLPMEPALNSTPVKSVSSIGPPAGVLASDDAMTETEAVRLLRLGMIADNVDAVILTEDQRACVAVELEREWSA